MVRRADSLSAGLVPVKGQYKDIRIGSKIQGFKGTLNDVWEVIDLRNPDQYDYLTTPWMRVVNKATGETASIPPRTAIYPCTFMVPEETVDPEEEKPKLDTTDLAAHQPLSDQEAVDLLVRELGAVVEATQDRETGIVVCPPYEEVAGVPRGDYVGHIEYAHGIDLSSIKDGPIEALIEIHGQAHSKNWTKPRSNRGFPHQHQYRESRKPFGNLA
jgi:hypothetical protein